MIKKTQYLPKGGDRERRSLTLLFHIFRFLLFFLEIPTKNATLELNFTDSNE